MIPPNNDMRFEVTTKCNYNCVICPREELTRRKETMSLELFRMLFDKILAETDQYDTLSIPGMGEPLLDETLEEKIRYAKKARPDMQVLILTNGSRLTPEKFLRLQEIGATSVRVSLYGHDPDTYCSVHGISDAAMYERVKGYVLEALKLRTTTQVLLTLNVVTGHNDTIVDDWIAFWKDKVDLAEVWYPHNWGKMKHYRAVQQAKLATCKRPFTGPLQVQVDGTVNMCCFDIDGVLTLGDLKTQSLEEIFSSPLYQKIAACHTSGDYARSGLICDQCDQRNADKSDVMVFDSKFDIAERVKVTSTTYSQLAD